MNVSKGFHTILVRLLSWVRRISPCRTQNSGVQICSVSGHSEGVQAAGVLRPLYAAVPTHGFDTHAVV